MAEQFALDGVLKRKSILASSIPDELKNQNSNGGPGEKKKDGKVDKKKQNATLISLFDEADRINAHHINNSWDNPDGVYYDLDEGVIRVGPKHFDLERSTKVKDKSPRPSPFRAMSFYNR